MINKKPKDRGVAVGMGTTFAPYGEKNPCLLADIIK